MLFNLNIALLKHIFACYHISRKVSKDFRIACTRHSQNWARHFQTCSHYKTASVKTHTVIRSGKERKDRVSETTTEN
jgi:putative component of membrane protein insertase Oxa1/YidC/SpoIIIJ protein YidD